jgi:putative endonuclease
VSSVKGDGRGARGRAGEEAAQALIERSGYRIVDTNVRFGRTSGLTGEIDIVAWDGPTLCFVEVKTRRGTPGRVFPEEAMTERKQRQIARLALAYAAKTDLLSGDSDVGLRFDVVTVILAPGADDRVRRAELWRGAFLAPDET